MGIRQKIWKENDGWTNPSESDFHKAQLVLAFGARELLEVKCELHHQTMTITTFFEL